MDGLFDDPGDLGFFDKDDVSIPDEVEDEGLSSWVDDVDIVVNDNGSGSFKGKLTGVGF